MQTFSEYILLLLGVEFVSITAPLDSNTLARCQARFDSFESGVRIFISTYAVAGQSVNLHHDYHHVVFVELPDNAASVFQALGERTGSDSSTQYTGRILYWMIFTTKSVCGAS